MCHSPPPARATVRASGGASVTRPSGVQTATAVGATPWMRPPANARRPRVPGPTTSGRRTRRPSSSPRRRCAPCERRGRRSGRLTRGAEQVRRPVLAEPGEHLRGAERPERAPRPAARRRSKRALQAGAEVDLELVGGGAQVRRRVDAEAVAVERTVSAIAVCSPPGWAASVTIAQSRARRRRSRRRSSRRPRSASSSPRSAVPCARRGSPNGPSAPGAIAPQREMTAWVTGMFQRVSASASDSSSR